MTAARWLLALVALLSATPALAKKPLASGERIDLNRASVAQLMRLPGVGRSKAEAIAAQRARAPFRRIEDVLAVKGVSPGWLEKHRAQLTVGAAAAPAKQAPGKVTTPHRP